ncbi:MAG: hypothetical protein IJI41_14215 [Anaerolineaceae bacterium]|nr:hypothetical protein [Anaerolineaceae bacterium]
MKINQGKSASLPVDFNTGYALASFDADCPHRVTVPAKPTGTKAVP